MGWRTTHSTLAAILSGYLVGCAPPGLAPSVPLRALPSLERRSADDPPGRPTGYYRFTESEWRQLDPTPCRFHPASKRAARLYRRGFSKVEIIQACRDITTHTNGDQRYLEHLAVWRRSGLPLAKFKTFMGSEKSITDYYNREELGGRGLAIGGWILTSLGLALFAGAAATTINYEVQHARCLAREMSGELSCDHDGGSALGVFIGALFQVGFGVLLLAPGLPMGIVGQLRQRRWLRGELLDVGHVQDLDRFRLRSLERSRRPTVRTSVTPLITRGGGGLMLRLRW